MAKPTTTKLTINNVQTRKSRSTRKLVKGSGKTIATIQRSTKKHAAVVVPAKHVPPAVKQTAETVTKPAATVTATE
jgi:hypothetical protein